MSQSENIVNSKEKRTTIIRVLHNRENPFVQLNRKALWDEDLSLKATGLWARCMSRPDDWTFSITELVKHCKEGRLAVDSAMKELVDAGYVCVLEYSDQDEKGRFCKGGIEYVFFEFKATDEEKEMLLEDSRKFYRNLGFRNCGYRNRGNPQLLIEKTLTEKDSDKERETSSKVPSDSAPSGDMTAKAVEVEPVPSSQKKEAKPKIDISPQVKELTESIKQALLAHKADYNVPQNLNPWWIQVDFLLRLDKRSHQTVLDVLNWALSDSFWADKMFKPNPVKYLREKFDQLQMKMSAKPIQSKKVDRRIKDNTGKAIEDQFKDNLF